MQRALTALAAAFAAVALQAPAAAAADYAPLQLYQGDWRITMDGAPPKRLSLHNDCGRIGTAFGCQQSIDGTRGGWVLFLPTDQPGRWKTQNIMPDGVASGPAGDLTIDGDLWTYLSHEGAGAAERWFRVTNRFSGADKIRFEQARSTDGKTWTPVASGETVRVGPGG